ncbi:MAG: RNA polymerase sigma factor [Cyclobacteriaceae bacterium]|nr:RNA polymerase sigma factor [Cyclobacteriaceae bacterium SS2]
MEAIDIDDFNYNRIKEKAVIKRILGGEKELYEILVRRNNQKLYRIIRGYLSDESEIEDVMQNSYLKAYTKLYQFNLNSQFSTWLVRIAINESLAVLKKKGNVVHLSDSSRYSKDRSVLDLPDLRQLNPLEKMTLTETRYLLEATIDRLEVRYRTVYIMKEVEEMSLKEIAASLDISISNVKIRLHRSREMIKETLYEMSNDAEIFEFGSSRCDRVTEQVLKRV